MTGPESLQPALDDPRVIAALEEYLAAMEEGETPNRQAFLARHAAVALPLAECLAGLEALHVADSASQHPVATPTEEGSTGAPLGDFRIIREIGRGGMGVVYEAEQLSLGRRVALKVLPFAAALDARQLQRFKHEAQAAAHLHHPHIVPVYGVGADRGVHYYAMQLIEGQNLAGLITDLRHPTAIRERSPLTDSSPVNLLPSSATRPVTSPPTSIGAQLSTQRSSRAQDYFRTVARLMVQAAEALDYAHGVGVVHRDIKPANLLVDHHGDVWIADFGLAQFHADAGLTQTGDLLGTLRYMSPEQAGGQRVLIDHRTDVYSLGATLYELLTLRPIFDGADRHALLHQILHEDPRPPRSVDRAIPAELETIALKAVAKAPADRYGTAAEFADDLHRFLRDEPIRARRPTLTQHAWKWLRRHPSIPIAVGVLLHLLAAGSLVSAWLIGIEQDKTHRAYEAERQRAEDAERQFQLARRSVDGLIKIAEDELADSPHLQSLRKRLLESALEYYEEFIEQRRDDPAAQPQLEATKARVKKILDDLAVLQGAGQLSLLTEAAVLDDLRLTEEQRARIAELSDKLTEQREQSFKGFHRLGEDERRTRFLELARTNEAAVAGILTQEKLRRLQQIELQRQGPAAFRDPDIVAALKLTAEQRDRIHAIEDSVFSRPEGFRFGPRGGPMGKPRDPPMRPPMERAQALKTAMERIQAVLTEEQARRWKEMTGEPFKAAFASPRFGPR